MNKSIIVKVTISLAFVAIAVISFFTFKTPLPSLEQISSQNKKSLPLNISTSMTEDIAKLTPKKEKSNREITACDLTTGYSETDQIADKKARRTHDKLRNIIKKTMNSESEITYLLTSDGSDSKELVKGLKHLRQKYSNNKLISYDLLSLCASKANQ